MSNPSTRRLVATLKKPTQVPALIVLARAVHQKMSNNPYFKNPDPGLDVLDSATVDLENAEAAVKAGGKGATTARNGKKKTLVTLLEQERMYVQKVADGDEANAQQIIESSGMSVRKLAVRARRGFAAKQGAVSAAVTLTAPYLGPRTSYEWQSSLDGGKTWNMLPPSIQSRLELTGLQVGATYMFRYRPVTKKGPGDWSEPTSILVK